MGAFAITVFIYQAFEQDAKNTQTREDLKEALAEIELLEEEKWQLVDENWILSEALKTADGELDKRAETIKELEEYSKSLEEQVSTLKTDVATKLKGNSYIQVKSIDVNASAYTQSPEEGTADGITKTETKVHEGRTVAVDPKMIPLGSTLYIESDSPLVGGFYIAEDIGGAIKDNRIDIFMNSKAQAFKFGRQNVKVTILKGI